MPNNLKLITLFTLLLPLWGVAAIQVTEVNQSCTIWDWDSPNGDIFETCYFTTIYFQGEQIELRTFFQPILTDANDLVTGPPVRALGFTMNGADMFEAPFPAPSLFVQEYSEGDQIDGGLTVAWEAASLVRFENYTEGESWSSQQGWPNEFQQASPQNYIGFMTLSDGQPHYGWMSWNLIDDGFSIELQVNTVAIESIPNQAIQAGSLGCASDVDGSGVTDVNDLLLLVSEWEELCNGCPSDVDGDGEVNVNDLLLLISSWEEPCD